MNLSIYHPDTLRASKLILILVMSIVTMIGFVAWLTSNSASNASIQSIASTPPLILFSYLILIAGLACIALNKPLFTDYCGKFAFFFGVSFVASALIVYVIQLSPGELIDSYYGEVIHHTPLAIGLSLILAGLLLSTHENYPTQFIGRYDTLLTAFLLLPLLSIFSFIFNPNSLELNNIFTMPPLSGLFFLLFFFGLTLQTRSKGAAGLLTRKSHSAKNFRILSLLVLVVPLSFASGLAFVIDKGFVESGFANALFCLLTSILIIISLAHNAISQDQWLHRLTKEKKKNDALKNNIHELLDISEDGILLFDQDLNIIHTNSGASKILGWQQDEFQSLSIYDLMPPEHAKEYQVFMSRFLKRTRQHSYDIPSRIYAQTKSGEKILLSITVSKKTSSDKTLAVAILKSLKDIDKKISFLETQAKTDPLTNTLNRTEFESFCENLSKYPPRESDKIFCVIFLDLDNFKNVNDKYGHDVGDYALKASADAIQNTLRGNDKLFRVGGEEFVILAQHVSVDNAIMFADRIRMAVKSNPIRAEKVKFHVTCSIGVCMADLKNTGIKAAVKSADESMYQAKHRGRDQIVIVE